MISGEYVFVLVETKDGQYVSKFLLTSVQRNSKIVSPNVCLVAHEKNFAFIPELKKNNLIMLYLNQN